MPDLTDTIGKLLMELAHISVVKLPTSGAQLRQMLARDSQSHPSLDDGIYDCLAFNKCEREYLFAKQGSQIFPFLCVSGGLNLMGLKELEALLEDFLAPAT